MSAGDIRETLSSVHVHVQDTNITQSFAGVVLRLEPSMAWSWLQKAWKSIGHQMTRSVFPSGQSRKTNESKARVVHFVRISSSAMKRNAVLTEVAGNCSEETADILKILHHPGFSLKKLL